MAKGLTKDVRKLVRDLEAAGWTVTKTGGGHYKAVPPHKSGSIVYFGSTPSDRRALANTIARLRQSGYQK